MIKKISREELSEILFLHRLWVEGKSGGVCADLTSRDLSNIDLHSENLYCATFKEAILNGAKLENCNLERACFNNASLRNANLRGAQLANSFLNFADLQFSDFTKANLNEASLKGSNLTGVSFERAYLNGVNLCGANLRSAELSDSFLNNVSYNYKTCFFALQCPEEGPFIAWKKASNHLVKLLIPADAKRSSATTRKCRASKAKVLEIRTLNGSPDGLISVFSNFDGRFEYKVGTTVEVENFCTDRWRECAPGIHFFMTKEEAANY